MRKVGGAGHPVCLAAAWDKESAFFVRQRPARGRRWVGVGGDKHHACGADGGSTDAPATSGYRKPDRLYHYLGTLRLRNGFPLLNDAAGGEDGDRSWWWR
jgi:hypothetical protein